MLVTGQSLVLYSRLGVVLGPGHDSILRAVKWMIIIDGIVLHTTTTVVMFGTYNAHPNTTFKQGYKYVEKIQMTIFTLQELIISGLYVWRTLDILKTSERGGSQRRRRVMIELFGINVLIIVFDIALLAVEFRDLHVIEQAVKSVVYSIKLKLEFAILSKLVSIAQRPDVATVHDTYATIAPSRGASVVPNDLYLAPFQTDKAVSGEKDDILHIEQAYRRQTG